MTKEELQKQIEALCLENGYWLVGTAETVVGELALVPMEDAKDRWGCFRDDPKFHWSD